MVSRSIQALSVVPVGDAVQVRKGTDVIRIDSHTDEIWAILQHANGRTDDEAVIELAASSSSIDREILHSVMSDLRTLGVLVDSRELHSVVIPLSDNPMPFLSDMRMADYREHEQRAGWQPTGKPVLSRISAEEIRPKALPSCRAFAAKSPDREAILQILSHSAYKPASAGGLYPIRFTVILNRKCGALGPGVYHYHSKGRMLVSGPGLSKEEIRYLLNRQDGIYGAPAVILISGDMKRQTAKYSNRGWRYTLIESGIAVERIRRAADQLDLRTLVFGGYDDRAARRLLFDEDASAPYTIVAVAVGYSGLDSMQDDEDLEQLHAVLDAQFVGEESLIESTGSTDLWRNEGDLSFHQVLAVARSTDAAVKESTENRTCSGTGASTVSARAKAIVESIERHVCKRIAVHLKGAQNEINPDFDFQEFSLLSQRQIESHGFLQHFDPALRIEWCNGLKLKSGKTFPVPVDLVYYPISTEALGRPVFCAANSSGVASHTNVEEARFGALLEVLERHAVLASWHSQVAPSKVPLEGYSKYLSRRREYWQSQGFEVHIFDYRGLSAPIAGVAITSLDRKPFFVFGSASSRYWDDALLKAFHEAELGVAGRRSVPEEPMAAADVESPLDHGRFHAYDPDRHAWTLLSQAAVPPAWTAPPPADVSELYQRFDPVFIDIESPAPIFTVRCLIPRLIPASFGSALEYRPQWSRAPLVPHFIA